MNIYTNDKSITGFKMSESYLKGEKTMLGRKFCSAFILGMMAVCMSSETVFSEEEPKIEIKSVNCRELLLMNGEDAGFTMVFFHGYMSGKNNFVSFYPDAYAKTTDQVRNHCIDNPQELLIDVFEKYRYSPSTETNR